MDRHSALHGCVACGRHLCDSVHWVRRCTARRADVCSTEGINFWHRPTSKNVVCPNDPVGLPLNAGLSHVVLDRTDAPAWTNDAVYAAAMIRSPANLTITSGNNTQTTLMQAGINYASVPMGAGAPSFRLTRGNVVRAAQYWPR